jgi:hypothetical protein
MTVRNAGGQRTARVIIPIQGAGTGREQDARLRADAGDDQIGLVGRRITLNGSQSAPGQGIIYRWFQLAGPKVEQAIQEKYYYAFTPADPGIYRFGLVVAASSGSGEVSLSDLDEVVVTVGEMPSTFGGPSLGGVAGAAPLAALDQALQGPGSIAVRATLDQVASVLEAISARATLYTTFAELTSELMRRLDVSIPADPNARQFWAQAVFSPLTQHTVAELLAVGLDLRLPQAHQQPLNPAQQERLRKLFAGYAREFRSRTQAR